MNITNQRTVSRFSFHTVESRLSIPLSTLSALIFFFFLNSSFAGTFTVRNTDDSGPDSLRQAIEEAKINPGPDAVHFDIPGGAPHTIRPLSQLPAVTDPIVIDGWTQPGFAGQPIIELDGSQAGADASGIWIQSGQSTIRGLVINRFGWAGVLVEGNGDNIIEGNYVGTDVTGAIARGNVRPGVGGLLLVNSSRNRIGGTLPEQRNVISGNDIGIHLETGDSNIIQGNFIGTDATGTVAMGNSGRAGIHLFNASNTLVGGSPASARNLISGNNASYPDDQAAGLEIVGHSGIVTGNVVQGNLIGTDVTGTLALPNRDGISVSGAPGNLIGGAVSGAGNLISGNERVGIQVGEGIIIQGNLIGTDITGAAALPNQDSGMWVWGGDNQIGGTSAGARNIISGNGSYGIELIRPNNRVQGNFIGTDVTGTAPIGNGQSAGVHVCCDSTSGLIGGTEPGAGNVISGNHVGIRIGVSGTVVEGNFIGTDVTGTAALPNTLGIYLADNASGNVIGGTMPGAGNLISGNSFRGITIFHSGSTGNFVQGNFIGTDVTGTAALPNFEAVFIADGASQNLIGGTTAGAGNLIAYNLASGVVVAGAMGQGAMPLQNTIRGNSMHANGWLGIDLVNGDFEPIAGLPTANDPLDADPGPNHLQNFPELESSMITRSGILTVKGSLRSAPNSTFDLEFFASAERDPSGHGEGETFLGARRVSTDRAGHVKFTIILRSTGLAAGAVITATATDLDGNTSEFSRGIPTLSPGPPDDRNRARATR